MRPMAASSSINFQRRRAGHGFDGGNPVDDGDAKHLADIRGRIEAHQQHPFALIRPQVDASFQPAAKRRDYVLRDLETVEIHDLGPRGDKVRDKLLLGVGSRIHFGSCAQLCIRAEDQVHA